jgi:predicted MFS family arabinose efflux permease
VPALGTQIASFAVAVTTASSIGGRLALGFVIDRLEPRAVSAVAFTLQAGALIALSCFDAQWALFAACVVYGVWIGNLITLPALIIQGEFRPGVFAATMGLVTSISQFTFAFGPGLLGLLRDTAGSYVPVLLTCAVFNVTAGALILVPRYASRHIMIQRGRPAPDARRTGRLGRRYRE